MLLHLFEYSFEKVRETTFNVIGESDKTYKTPNKSFFRKIQENEVVNLSSVRGFRYFTTNKETYKKERPNLFNKVHSRLDEKIQKYTDFKELALKQERGE